VRVTSRWLSMWAFILLGAMLLAGCGGTQPSALIDAQATVAPPAVNPTQPPAVVATSQPTQRPAPTATASPTALPPTVTPTTQLPTMTPTSEPPTPTPDPCPGAIPWNQAIDHAGQEITVIGQVMDATWASSSRGKPTFLNLGAVYPDPGRFTVLMWIDARYRFDAPPEELFMGKTVCVTGTIQIYRDGAEMEVEFPGQIIVP